MSSDPSDLNSSEPVTSLSSTFRSLNSLFRESVGRKVLKKMGVREMAGFPVRALISTVRPPRNMRLTVQRVARFDRPVTFLI